MEYITTIVATADEAGTRPAPCLTATCGYFGWRSYKGLAEDFEQCGYRFNRLYLHERGDQPSVIEIIVVPIVPACPLSEKSGKAS